MNISFSYFKSQTHFKCYPLTISKSKSFTTSPQTVLQRPTHSVASPVMGEGQQHWCSSHNRHALVPSFYFCSYIAVGSTFPWACSPSDLLFVLNYLFRSSAHFWARLLIFYYWVLRVLCIFWIAILHHLVKTFWSVTCLLILLEDANGFNQKYSEQKSIHITGHGWLLTCCHLRYLKVKAEISNEKRNFLFPDCRSSLG